MRKIFVTMLLATFGLGAGMPTAALADVTASCDNDNQGARRAIKCNVSQTQLGISSKGNSATARKLYINKPAGDTGEEVVRLWIDGKPAGEFRILPGTQHTLFRKKHNSSIVANYEIETVKLPTNGPSQFYVHFESLTPVTIDQAKCSNTADGNRTSVCWSGSF